MWRGGDVWRKGSMNPQHVGTGCIPSVFPTTHIVGAWHGLCPFCCRGIRDELFAEPFGAVVGTSYIPSVTSLASVQQGSDSPNARPYWPRRRENCIFCALFRSFQDRHLCETVNRH